MRLVRPEDIRTRLGIPDLEVVKRAISEHVDAATEALRSSLRAEFEEVSQQVDLFYAPDSSLTGGRFERELLLTRGLVNEELNALQVEVAPRRINLINGGDESTSLRDVDEAVVEDADEFVLVKPTPGIVVVQDFRLVRTYAQVTYDAGITADRRKPTELFMQSAPTVTASATFADADPDTITISGGSFVTEGFAAGDEVSVSGSSLNDGSYTVASRTATVLTLAATDELVAEGPTAGVTITATSVQPVPTWLKELAEVHAMLELVTTKTMGEVSAQRAIGEKLRPQLLERRLCDLLDRYTRYHPKALKPLN